MIEKVFNAVDFLLSFICSKIRYGKRINLSGLGRVSRKAKITIKNNGTIEFKKGTRICEYSSISSDGGTIVFGENVGINRNTIISCHGKISIGKGTLIAPNVCIFDHNHRFNTSGLSSGYSVGDVSIGDNCWIGANVTILKNTRIGDGCIIGAGCVVSGDIPAHTLVKSNRELAITVIEPREK